MAKQPLQILVLHGPNLNMLGSREPDIYGTSTLEEINQEMIDIGEKQGAEIKCFQSNHEGRLIDLLYKYHTWTDGIIVNPGAFTHYSLAIYDALLAVNKPAIEVHLSNIFKREVWRQKSVISAACLGIISGFGKESYFLALQELIRKLQEK